MEKKQEGLPCGSDYWRDVREAAKKGIEISPEDLYREFRNWSGTVNQLKFKNLDIGEVFFRMGKRRGNAAYASAMRKKQLDLEFAFKGMRFDSPIPGYRTSEFRQCLAFLVTFTYNPKLKTRQNAWGSLSHDIAITKILLKRRFGAGHVWSMLVKEGNKNGYPAPHLLFIVDRPIMCKYHVGKENGNKTWRLNDWELLKKMKKCWKNGFSDVQAVVNGEVRDDSGRKRDLMPYLFKYLTKTVKLDREGNPDLANKQFAYQKLFNMRSMQLSRQFKDLFNRDGRLDTIFSESQQISLGRWVFEGSILCSVEDFYSSILKGDGKPREIEERNERFRESLRSQAAKRLQGVAS